MTQKENLEELLKKYPYGTSVFYLKCKYENKICEMTHYSKHFIPKDAYLEIDNPKLKIAWRDVLEIKLYN